MKPRIGIDIDDVLSETALFALEEMRVRYSYSLDFSDVTHFEWAKIEGFPLDLAQNIEFFREILGDINRIHKVQPVEGAVESILSLSKNFELHAITARHTSTEEATHIWIQKHFGDIFSRRIDFLGLMHSGRKISKGDACEQYELEVFVEDNIDYAMTVVEKGIPCFLFERPWNIQRVETHPLLTRVKNWKEIQDNINRLYQI